MVGVEGLILAIFKNNYSVYSILIRYMWTRFDAEGRVSPA
jgi:hypothetical protein